jgi:hypothetical protein
MSCYNSICETKTITTQTLYDYFKIGQIQKPRIQRKKRWITYDEKSKKTNDVDFINFIVNIRNLVNPIHFAMRYMIKNGMVSGEYYCVIDGNNRINALINFLETPLKTFEHLIPIELKTQTKKIKKSKNKEENEKIIEQNELINNENEKKKEIVNFLKNLSYDEINTYKTFEMSCSQKHKNFELNNLICTEINNIFNKIIKFKFLSINIPINIFKNISQEKMSFIFQGINKGGEQLTPQEILASMVSNIIYDSNELTYYSGIKKYVDKYYNLMDTEEVLSINFNTSQLNLFEVLLGFQKYLHYFENTNYQKIYDFIEDTGKGKFDLIFKCYEYIFSEIGYTQKNPYINLFMNNIIKICNFIHNNFKHIYDSEMNIGAVKDRKLNLNKNTCVLLITYLYKNISKLEEENFKNEIKRIIIYHELCGFLSKYKELESNYHTFDPLKYEPSGSYIESECKKIMNGKLFIAPELSQIKKLLQLLISQRENYTHEQHPKKRKYLTKFNALILCIYYNDHVPKNKDGKLNLEHIFPWSASWKGELYLDRIGNLLLIDEHTNKKKSDKNITEKFINEHKLYYYNYPSDKQYNEICKNKNINANKYNNECDKRENKYITHFIDYCKK